jgi:hypothetical protein
MRASTCQDRDNFAEVVASDRPGGDSFVEVVAISEEGLGDE